LLEEVAKAAENGQYLDKKMYEKLKRNLQPNIVEAIQVQFYFLINQEGTLDFIRENLNHLPMYFVPEK
jgi:hypothetical protein